MCGLKACFCLFFAKWATYSITSAHTSSKQQWRCYRWWYTFHPPCRPVNLVFSGYLYGNCSCGGCWHNQCSWKRGVWGVRGPQEVTFCYLTTRCRYIFHILHAVLLSKQVTREVIRQSNATLNQTHPKLTNSDTSLGQRHLQFIVDGDAA